MDKILKCIVLCIILAVIPWVITSAYKELETEAKSAMTTPSEEIVQETLHEVYPLQKISSLYDKVEIKKKENNSLIGQFFLGRTEKRKKEHEKVISLQYAIQTEDGIQLKDFKKEFNRNIFSDDVFFKEATANQAKITIDYEMFVFPTVDKITFYLPKEDLEQILSMLQD